MERADSHSGELAGNHLDDARADELRQFGEALHGAALRMLRDDPTLWARKPELERRVKGLVNAGKLAKPGGLSGLKLEGAIVDAVDWAVDDFRHKSHFGADQGSAAPDGACATTASDSHEAGAAERPKQFPEICIRGTCEKWIETLEPRGEWPRAFLFEEWRMIHSMAIARGTGFGNGKLRHPHCHDLLIGESGITHKNTSINRAVSVIRMMRPDTCILGNVSSIEGVLEELDDKRRSVGLIAVGEYSYLVATSQRKGTSNMLPVLNDAYDGVDPLTIVRKKAPVIQAPFLNLVAGCTPAWIGEYADKEGADLGRFNRCTVFQADQDRDIPNPDYLKAEEQAEFARLFDSRIAEALRQGGGVAFEPEAHEWFEQWFFEYRRRLRSLPDNLRKLMERDDDQLKIQVLIYAVADGRRVASLEDFKAAAGLVEWSRENKMRLFGEVEFDRDQRLERLILRWVERGGGTLKDLWRYLGSTGKTEAVHRKLRAMSGLGLVALSKPLDDPSREPLRIYPVRSDGKLQAF